MKLWCRCFDALLEKVGCVRTAYIFAGRFCPGKKLLAADRFSDRRHNETERKKTFPHDIQSISSLESQIYC